MGGADDGLMEIWEEEGEGIQVDGGGEGVTEEEGGQEWRGDETG